jgi:aspartate aminotransferase-like enzyme
MGELIFKTASEPWEFDEVHKLNYETFVEEIPQHERNETRTLVDKFHEENTYAICLSDGKLLGMLALRAQRPFSLDSKLDKLDAYLPQGRSLCEIRLLAVRKDRRNGQIFLGLMKMAADYCTDNGYDVAVISGTVSQERLYGHMGFVPFGPLVGKPGALYQPMYLTADSFHAHVARLAKAGMPASAKAHDKAPASATGAKASSPSPGGRVINLLPGPVNVHADVLEAFRSAPVSHRSDRFVEDVKDTKRMLCALVGARFAEIFQGSGTLANDVVAAELSLLSTPGIVLSNGEFGERLVNHSEQSGLNFEVIRADWGAELPYAALAKRIINHPAVGWVWMLHCETSTGVLNDLPRVLAFCKERNIKVCVDAISSIGTLPVALGDVFLASCASGKGIAGLPGLAVVFHNHEIGPANRKVPRYLDLAHYAAASGVPFTFSSNLLHAFQAALHRIRPRERFERIRELSAWFRAEVRKHGFAILAPDDCTSPAVTTIVFPPSVSSQRIGHGLEERGCLVSYNSDYLLKRNWVQICLMGECCGEDLAWASDQMFGVAATLRS